MKTPKKLIGERVKEIRKSKCLTQEQVSEISGIDSKYLSMIEVGKRYPSLDYLERLAEIFGVDLSEFFNYSHLQIGEAQGVDLKRMVDELSEREKQLLVKLIKAIKL